MAASARSLSQPITTRSGRMKSVIAEPSRRNSGLAATSNPPCGRVRHKISATFRPVPTGTVDFVTTTEYCPSFEPISSAAAKT
jgi:hypothetical protein